MKKLAALLVAVSLLVAICPLTYAAGYTVIVEPQYNMAETFECSVTKVSKNTKWALADATGNAITAYQWEAMGDITSEYIPAKSGNLWGYVSPTGKVMIPYRYLNVGTFRNGVAMAQTKEGVYVYINVYGDTLFKSPFTYSFSPSDGAICGMKDNVYGYCDTEGNIIIHPQFDMAFDFHEGYAAVQFGGKWGFITSYGAYSVRPTYDFVSDFQNGHAICRLNGKYGIINTAGTRTSSFDFDYIGVPGDDGLYPAKAGSVSGYINASGQWKLKTAYDFCYRYTNGVARVYHNGLWGFIDVNGNELFAPTFVDLGEYHNQRAPYSLDGSLWGYLTLTSTVAKPKPVQPVNPTPTVPEVTEPVVESPAEPVKPPETTEKTETPQQGGSSTPATPPEILNPANDSSRPLDPKEERCISMKINSSLALKGTSEITLAEPPVLIDGTTMIPVRDIVEVLGGTIAWNAENQRINISWNHMNVSMTIGSKISYVNGVPDYLSAAPVIVNGTTLVPLRSVSTALHCNVEWVDTHQNIYIYY